MIAEYTVPGVATEISRPGNRVEVDPGEEGIVAPAVGVRTRAFSRSRADDALDLKEITGLLDRVVKAIDAAPNRVRYTMNGFVIAVGSYVKPFLREAKATARKIGRVTVDMGETACKVPQASAYIAKVESMGRVGKKRKSARC